MDFSFLTYKPVLIGLHLGFAILGIDAFLWLTGEFLANTFGKLRVKIAAVIGVAGFALSWLAGGYYYVVYYGKLVKPVIKEGVAPWAHAIFMETKEHIFLFVIPLAVTALLLAFLKREEIKEYNLSRLATVLVVLIALLGLLIGAMGYIISAAARWG
ncbi:MAG: hypothetical protein HYX21_00900 [Candidatus Yanofskybacteria bacterium]|nr:hypothetical protein [Candidatus Yanofskybacteria bacterium]